MFLVFAHLGRVAALLAGVAVEALLWLAGLIALQPLPALMKGAHPAHQQFSDRLRSIHPVALGLLAPGLHVGGEENQQGGVGDLGLIVAESVSIQSDWPCTPWAMIVPLASWLTHHMPR